MTVTSVVSQAYEIIGATPKDFTREGPLAVSHSDLPEHSFSGSGVTYTFQIRILRISSEWSTVFHKGNEDYPRSPSLFVNPGTSNLHARFATRYDANEGINECRGIPSGRVGTDDFTHIAVTLHGDTIKVYSDGELIESWSGRTALESTQDLRIGRSYYGPLNAELKCFRFYPFELSAEDIKVDWETEDQFARAGDAKEAVHEFEGLLKGAFSDMKLLVGSGEETKEFPGHKAILGSRSGYVEAIAESKFSDSSLSKLEFPMFLPGDFQKFLRLIYLEEFNIADNAEGARLLNIIEFMQVKPAFLGRLSDDLAKKINLKNFASVAELVLRYGSAKAQRQVKSFFVSKYKSIAKSEEFFALSRESMKLLIQHHATSA